MKKVFQEGDTILPRLNSSPTSSSGCEVTLCSEISQLIINFYSQQFLNMGTMFMESFDTISDQRIVRGELLAEKGKRMRTSTCKQVSVNLLIRGILLDGGEKF